MHHASFDCAAASASAPPPSTPPPVAATDPLWLEILQRAAAAEVVQDAGIQFVLRVAARLRDKPKPPAACSSSGIATEWRNPFLPYEKGLGVANIGVAAATSEVAPGCPVELRSLPFAGFAAALDVPQAGDAGAYLAGCYQELLSCCRTFVEGKTGRRVDVLDGSLSYNLILTTEFMLLVPRRAEGDGPVSCNAVAFAGSIFVKSLEEQRYVEQRKPLHILSAVGFEW
ncbi:hypothetical protein CHLNCDRAFT_138409 [Chlorella variabilis]|uniref:Uncharacterized protein n=1 Tax=Chlorella variabilis TaxID=554065 RepID=E1ZN00_CHLVA|nr:hypothetical protein CHLNCDRAFT_138409 [Chlorella variabilis]EFN52782.1 hypothetical protein CHLNCDRAFT_138409 [Chlorella variabilis]|eukprot:XP_005844884.1 hypothetical protein CHLNCDRAFT_138409 [Chlorella variabilis]